MKNRLENETSKDREGKKREGHEREIPTSQSSPNIVPS